jgi:NAD(P)-dependent dehydrogenase (short-subunit alcohol dehydrogenase family)
VGDRLAGKVALITGAARGQGAAEARLFAQEGAMVVLGDVLDGEGQALAAAINAGAEPAHPRAIYVHLDVTNAEQWNAAIDVAERDFGALNILVNNAGVSSTGALEAISESEWQRAIDVNQKGVWLGMKAAIPAMRRAGAGSIVNVASVYSQIGSSASFAYHASKGAVRTMTRAAAVCYAPERIRVNAVHPGVIRTPMLEEATLDDIKKVTSRAPMRREGTPEEIAYGVLYLASEEASFVTGVDLNIDGGWTAW